MSLATIPSTERRIPLAVRFWRLVDAQGPMACWLWEGAQTSAGYGAVNEGGRGATLLADHVCRVRLCVNPVHLELVDHAENMQRIPRESCPNGHPYTATTTGTRTDGTRQCLICKAARQARYERRRSS